MSFVTIARGYGDKSGDKRGTAFVQAVLAQDAAQLAAQEAELARRVRNEVNKLKAEALAEARAAGEAEAKAAMAPQAARLERATVLLTTALGQLAAPLAAKESELAGLVTELGFIVGSHLAATELTSSPAGVQSLVARLLAEAASVQASGARLQLRVNPADAPALQRACAPATLLEDIEIAPGGVRLELLDEAGIAAPLAGWDATLAARIAAFRVALGLDAAVAA